MPAKKKENQLDPKIEVKKAAGARTLNPSADIKEETPIEGKNETKKKRNPFNTISLRRDISGTSIDPSGILYVNYENKKKGRPKSMAERATENLMVSLDPRVATIFKGTVTGFSGAVDPTTQQPVYFAMVNSNCNVEGYPGRIIRIRLEDFIAPVCTRGDLGRVFDPSEKSDLEIKKYLSSRKGSEVEFVVTAMDEEDYANGYVLGSRKQAMKRRREKFWFGVARKKDGDELDFAISEGSKVESRIVAVTAVGVYCEIFGVELFIPLRELSYSHISTARGLFNPGDIMMLRLTNVERRGKDIWVDASHKDTFPNPIPGFMKQYNKNDNLRGITTYTGFDTEKGRFYCYVRVDNKFEVRCRMKNEADHTPKVGQMVDFVVSDADIDVERNEGKMWGIINHIL